MRSVLVSIVVISLFLAGAKASPPDSVKNCSVTNYTADSVTLQCEEGYDGGLQQWFHLEVYNQEQEYLEANITSRSNPDFLVTELPPSTEYILVVYAANLKGRSSAVVMKAATADAPRSENGSVEQPDQPDQPDQGYTCVYNGTEYKQGEELPTRGRCWHCTCVPGFTKPGIEFCASIYCPYVAKDGCDPVYSEEDCCPVSWNCDKGSSNTTEPAKCNEQFFQHYKVKQCEPVYEEGNPCPVRFDCPPEYLTDNSVCYHNGKQYKIEESIPTTNPCRICSCETSFAGGAEIQCISVECPSAFHTPEFKEGCFPTYTIDSCCSIGEACDDPVNGTASEPLCEVDGKLYHAGQQIYPKDDPCLICICDENWNGISNSSCRKLDCVMEKRLDNLKEGCLPIYHETSCCPIEYHCESSVQDLIVRKDFTITDPDPTRQCVYKDKQGNIGDELNLKRSNNCVTCTCLTPPEFTCIHRSCPNPPNDDYENCKPIYTPGECCAQWECIQQAPPMQPICDPVYCREGCTEIMVPYGCPMCSCDEVLCSPPLCGPDCVIDYSTKPCPSCKCAQTIPLDRPQCGPVKCGPQCYEAISPQGCPMCVCGPLCSPPRCEHGCHVVTDVAEGQCPYCVCDHDQDSETDLPDRMLRVLCSPVRCPLDCREATGENGCPICMCDPLCSPPRCDPGCRMEVVPSQGPCPGCVCDDKVLDKLQCSPVKCSAECTEYVPPNGCPICQCEKVLCSMPRCPAGCEIDYNTLPCPSCQCPDTIPFDRPRCAPVKCGPGCYEGISPQGCPMCVCGPLCSPPKCDRGCTVQQNVPEGQCPGCDCPSERSLPDRLNKKLCAPVRCPLDCREATGQNGCPMCMCDPLCSPPKCDPGCRPEVAPRFGPCPGCVCDKVEKPRCAPVLCGLDCYESVSAQGCPMCVCGPQCSPPKCPVGCYVETNVPVGHCPGCECPRRAPQEEYSPDNCPQFCEVEEKDGVKECICHPLCSMPLCTPDCPLIMDVPKGSCPYCDCPTNKPDTPVLDTVMRAPAGPIGRLAPAGPLRRAGPVIPVSPLQCSPPKCDPGCTVQKSVPAGSCPGCDCPTVGRSVGLSVPEITPSVQCLPGCRRVVGVDGSTRCACGNCAIPKCHPQCTVRYNIGDCPTCDCAKQEAFPWCPPVETCDEGCNKVTTLNGCDACKCGDECVPPQCPPGCEVEAQTDPDKCPACKCRIKRPQELRCPDFPCQLPCRWVQLSPNVCPMCECGLGNTGQLNLGGLMRSSQPAVRCPDFPCQLPCRWVQLSPNVCPMCECGLGNIGGVLGNVQPGGLPQQDQKSSE